MKRAFLLALVALSSASFADFTMTLLHTNDLHAHAEPTKIRERTYGGYARHATLIKKYRAEDPNVLLVNGGDTFQGTLYFNTYQGLSDLAHMNYVGYQGMAVGNHEFDLGPKPFAEFAKGATFPLLAANLDVSAEPSLVNLVKPYAIVKVGTERVGLIGAITEDLHSISSPGDTVKMKPLMSSVKASVEDLIRQRVNKIVLLSHCGYDVEKRIANEVPEIDVIVGGHSHSLLGQLAGVQGFPEPIGPYPTVIKTGPHTTLLVSSWEWGKVLGRMKLTFDDQGRVKRWFDAAPVLVDESIPEDPTMASILMAFAKPIEALKKTVVATAPTALGRSRDDMARGAAPMANAIADAMLWHGKKSGANLALMNAGGVRAEIDAGPITFEEVIQVQPFGNTLVILDLTGDELYRVLEQSVANPQEKGIILQVSNNMRYSFDASKPVGSRVVSVTVDGQPVDRSKTYRAIVNSFIAGGGDALTVLKDAKGTRLDTGTLDRDVLVDWFKAQESTNLTDPRISKVGG